MEDCLAQICRRSEQELDRGDDGGCPNRMGGNMGQKKSCSKVSLIRIGATWRSLPRPSTSHRQRSLSLSELQNTMATFSRPVASSIAGVDFTVYSDAEIKKLSVKRIQNTPTLDSFNNPVPGGLYDPAMGAWGDHV